MFNLRQLRAFVTVAENKSFTQAARLLYMTQPAISAQIKSLEERLEIRLLERTDKTIVLTEAGEILFTEARKILAIHEGLIEAIGDLKGIRRGKLAISASNIPGEYVLPRYISQFHRAYPGINLSLKIADSGAVMQHLLKRVADLGVIGAPIQNELISLQPFMEDELIIIGPPGRGKTQTFIDLDKLMRCELVLREPESGTRMIFLAKLAEAGLDPKRLKITMELGSTRAVVAAVENGLGLSVVSRLAVRESLELGRVVEYQIKDLNLVRLLYLAWHKNKYQNCVMTEFIKFISGAPVP